jgi:hypothetical protein
MEAPVMSLSARERQALVGIADGLAHADPRLASLLATFDRLASGEDMSAGEKVPVARRDPLGWARWLYEQLGFQRIALLVWLVLRVALALFALSASHNAGHACVRAWTAAACAGPAPAHSPGPPRNTSAS